MPLKDIASRVSGKGGHSGPKWHALKQYFLSELEAGRYKPGDVLPSENQLCKAVGAARNTVRQAISELESEGFVTRIKGSGTFVADRSARSAGKDSPSDLDVFGLIIPEIRRSQYPSLVKGFDHRAAEEYHQVMICNTDYDINKQGDIILQIIDKKMGGVAMIPPTSAPTPPHQIRQLQSNGIGVVFCHRRVKGIKAPFVGWEMEQVGHIAAKSLVEIGHRDIAYFGVYRYEVTEAYERGLRKGLASYGLSLGRERVIYGPSRNLEDRDTVKEGLIRTLLESKDRPSAIFCSDDNEAERVYWVAHLMGISVPGELSIIGFGGKRREGVFRKQLASVMVDEFEIGSKAASLLCQMRSGEKPIDSNDSYLMDLELNDGFTLGDGPEGKISR